MDRYVITDTLRPDMLKEGMYVKEMPFLLLAELNMKGLVSSMLSSKSKKCIETVLGKELKDTPAYAGEKIILVVTNKDLPATGTIPADVEIKFLVLEDIKAGVTDVANKLIKKLF